MVASQIVADTLGAEMTETLLTRLGYPKAFVQRVAWIVKNHMRFHYFVQNGDANEKKWLRKEAPEWRVPR